MEDHCGQEGSPERHEVDKKQWAGQSPVRPGGARLARPNETEEKAKETVDHGSGLTGEAEMDGEGDS